MTELEASTGVVVVADRGFGTKSGATLPALTLPALEWDRAGSRFVLQSATAAAAAAAALQLATTGAVV